MISLTPEAIENIHRLQTENNSLDYGLRFGLTGGGCSGYRYVLEFESQPSEKDNIYEFNNIKVFVSPDHLAKLKGSIIGWKENLFEEGFDIYNPQAARACGCGESVDIEIKD